MTVRIDQALRHVMAAADRVAAALDTVQVRFDGLGAGKAVLFERLHALERRLDDAEPYFQTLSLRAL